MSTINYHLKQLDESGEVHLSEVIRKIQIPSEKWEEQGILMYNMDAVIFEGFKIKNEYEEDFYCNSWSTAGNVVYRECSAGEGECGGRGQPHRGGSRVSCGRYGQHG